MRQGWSTIAWWRVAWGLFIGSLVIPAWFAANLAYVATYNESDQAVRSDVIIVFGCPSYEGNVAGATFSACIQARARHAADLYKRGFAPHIIPTGGLTGPPPSEAGAMGIVLQGEGVPTTAIMLEEQARDTVQNVQYSRAIMRARGWHTAILVSEPNHIRRAALVAQDAGIEFTISPATDSPGWNMPSARWQNLWSDARTLMGYQIRRVGSGPP
jgi:uncharacterized SAM-binding protein YcdF (DUF218 family)